MGVAQEDSDHLLDAGFRRIFEVKWFELMLVEVWKGNATPAIDQKTTDLLCKRSPSTVRAPGEAKPVNGSG